MWGHKISPMLLRGNFVPLSNIGEILCSHIKSFCWRGGREGRGRRREGEKKVRFVGF